MTPDQLYTAEQAAALLGVSRSTFYALSYFKSRKIRTSEGTVRYSASDIARYQLIRRGE
jgi:predicted DNA-binding transcriptional regulator AlpA